MLPATWQTLSLQNKIQKGTLQLKHNDEVFQEVELPVRVDSSKGDRYYGLLAFVSNDEVMHVLLNKTPDEPFEEKTIVQVITFTKDGNLILELFLLSNIIK